MESGIYDNITSWDDLAALPTKTIINSVIVDWVEQASGDGRRTQLRMSTDTTDRINGVQRPDDFGAGNSKVWFEC